jgi:hypothetical protein
MLSNIFPRTFAEHPLLLDWNRSFTWATPLRVEAAADVLRAVVGAADESIAAAISVGIPLYDDISAATEATDDPARLANIDIFRFLLSVPIATAAVMEGDNGLAYDWVLAGITRTFKFGRNINQGDFRTPPYEAGDPDWNAFADANLLRWHLAFYTVALKLGGIDELAAFHLRGATALAIANFGAGRRADAIKLFALLGEWVAEHKRPQSSFYANQLVALLETATLSSRERLTSGIALAGRLAPSSGQTAGHWARFLLGAFAEALVEHERVQLMVLAADTVEAWREQRTDILAEIRALADFYRGTVRDGGDAGIILEARVKILHPLFYTLASAGTTDDVMDVLAAWYGKAGDERADCNILFVCPAYGNGTAYVWPDGRSLPQDDDPANLDRFLAALSLAQSQPFRGPLGDHPFDVPEHRWGMPNHAHASELREHSAALYDFTRLRRDLPATFRPRAIAVVPSHRDPFQAELGNVLGWLAPIEASVAMAAPTRERRIMSVWRDDAVQLVDAEIEMLRAIGPLGGWEIRVDDGPRTQDRFAAYYSDPEPDVLWVIGHGEMDAHKIQETGIMLSAGDLLSIRDVAAMSVPPAGRRLLVLNICSGGAAQNRGGLGHLGLAQSIAGPHQQVVAHQWPVDSHPALAFAASFAIGLINAEPSEALLASAIEMRDIDGLRDRLAAFAPTLSAIDRLNTAVARDNAQSVLNWGNAAIYT